MNPPIPLQQAASGSRVYLADVTWSPVGRFTKFGFTGQDNVAVREESLSRQYHGPCRMVFSISADPNTETWLHHQFALERLSREQSGKREGWHPTELYWCSDRIAAWGHAIIDESASESAIRIECGSRATAHEILTAVYRERWNRNRWEEAA